MTVSASADTQHNAEVDNMEELLFFDPSKAEGVPIPDAPRTLKRSMRWMQATVKNLTQFRIEHVDEYLQEGEFFQRPSDIAPLDQMTFSCRTRTGELTGCVGGARFRVHLHDGSHLEFAIGWQEPAGPAFLPRTGVICGSSTDLKYACRIGDERGNFVTSDRLEATDEAGTVAFRIKITAESPRLTSVESVYNRSLYFNDFEARKDWLYVVERELVV
ncbi:hypothetical protein L226DRAFT_615579 [Lentinus tigrinus ALCF2SS1-7]|uniref:Uncharacterized protein n=1 Tax=Lentinus tigrinus ALCF2SS1-6 TaxID=1328759 RepID=A0A5C2RUM0_9APHY|nr:hypothetical protein L227DRAFT_656967 [Lentinus tigrinus ALCF2SS1-6]RPD71293.1 hypothetical protein L226DRAFT_615579 [Lentinus tigrinus ALCF2SS1-7]